MPAHETPSQQPPVAPSAPLATPLAEQLAELRLIAGRPLLVVDADEVLFYFMRGFERYLEECGCYFSWSSFALNGNILRRDGDAAVPAEQVAPMLDRFFATATDTLEPVDGAAESLGRLSEIADIVVLSNLPYHARATRQAALKRHGMDYPLIANSGPKGPAMAALVAHNPRRAAFVDDIPHNHASIAKLAPMVHRVHFIADERLARLLPPSEHCQHRCDTWPAIEPHLAAYLRD